MAPSDVIHHRTLARSLAAGPQARRPQDYISPDAMRRADVQSSPPSSSPFACPLTSAGRLPSCLPACGRTCAGPRGSRLAPPASYRAHP